MPDKCPICGRYLETWTNDPILTPNGLGGEDYKGITVPNYIHIKELQDYYHQKEIDIGISILTEFSPINETGFFQNIKQYILELRSSIEKIISSIGITKFQYFNYDEDNIWMGTNKNDWSDLNLEEDKFQVKGIHIEDLRRALGELFPPFIEDWIKMKDYPISVFNEDIHNYEEVNVPLKLTQDTNPFVFSKTLDGDRYRADYGHILWHGDEDNSAYSLIVPYWGNEQSSLISQVRSENVLVIETKIYEIYFNNHHIFMNFNYNGFAPEYHSIYSSLQGTRANCLSYFSLVNYSDPIAHYKQPNNTKFQYFIKQYLSNITTEKNLLFKTISSGSVVATTVADNIYSNPKLISESGYIGFIIQFDVFPSPPPNDTIIHYRISLGTSVGRLPKFPYWNHPGGFGLTPNSSSTYFKHYDYGVTNLDLNLLEIFKNAFPAVYSAANRIKVGEINCNYCVQLESTASPEPPYPQGNQFRPQVSIHGTTEFNIDKISLMYGN
jgi:hypothetical protein